MHFSQLQNWPTPQLFVRTGVNGALSSVVLESDDTFWYRVAAQSLGFLGSATLVVDNTPVLPGIKAYLVLRNTTDNLRYRFKLVTSDGVVLFDVDTTPTLEAEDHVVLLAGSEGFSLGLVTDGSITWSLTSV